MSSVGLACLKPTVAFGRVEAGWDDGISSSESERFFCGDLIGEIGGGLSLISASMAMIWLSSSLPHRVPIRTVSFSKPFESAHSQILMPPFTVFMGRYCFIESCPLKATIASSTGKFCLGRYSSRKFFKIRI